MTAERYQQVKLLFDEALRRPAGERDAFVAEACGADAELRREVERLLSSDAEAQTFLDTPAFVEYSGLLEGASQPAEGRRLGTYRVLREIGRGGMGAVYLAARADEQFQKRVAIKLVKAGLENQIILERFRRERQILASLDHPSIAQLLDGGTTEEGRPYFVMEYVEGQPIDEYCGQRNLSIRERLHLFLPVCAAVQYAHQNLVVHRDLKPGNILVKADGSIKLLDFGIAKLLGPRFETIQLDRTAPSLRLMTPDYASPEQLRGEPVTTASDVYMLGVVLCELLSGKKPAPGTTGVGSVLKDAPPAIRRRLAGDIEAILHKALATDPSGRYGTAREMGEDLRRHLDGLPVLAHSQSLRYRLTKFVARNRMGVSAALIVFASLVIIAWLRTGGTQTAAVERELAAAYARLGYVQADLMRANRGDITVALESQQKALQLRQSLAARFPSDHGLARELVSSHEAIGDLLVIAGNRGGAAAQYRRMQAAAQAWLAQAPNEPLASHAVLTAGQKLNRVLMAPVPGVQ